MFCAIEPGLRLGAIARRRASKRKAGNAVIQAARERPPDRAEPGDGDADFGHVVDAILQDIVVMPRRMMPPPRRCQSIFDPAQDVLNQSFVRRRRPGD